MGYHGNILRINDGIRSNVYKDDLEIAGHPSYREKSKVVNDKFGDQDRSKLISYQDCITPTERSKSLTKGDNLKIGYRHML